MKRRHCRNSIILLILSVLILLAGACNNPLNLFTEFEGRNLIDSFQFGEDALPTAGYSWETNAAWWDDATQSSTANNFMVYEPLAGAELTAAQGVAGLPVTAPDGDAVTIYRLEVLNQFANGDFEAATAGAGVGVGNINGTGWASPGTIDVVNTGGDLSVFFESMGSELTVDLSTAVNSWVSDSEYTFHIDFISRTENYSYFFLDDGVADSDDDLYFYTIPNLQNNLQVLFPGSFDGLKKNYFDSSSVNADYATLYFGDTSNEFEAEIDNIRMLKMDEDYAITLQVPYSDSGRPDLERNGTFTFSVYVLEDTTVIDKTAGGADNRFNASKITMGVSSIYSNGFSGSSVSRSVDVSSASSWTKVSINASDVLKAIPSSGNPDVIELSLIASATGYSTSGGESSYNLDAGSIYIALPELTWSPE